MHSGALHADTSGLYPASIPFLKRIRHEKERRMKKAALEWKKIYSSPDFHREYLYEGKLGFFYENTENVFWGKCFPHLESLCRRE